MISSLQFVMMNNFNSSQNVWSSGDKQIKPDITNCDIKIKNKILRFPLETTGSQSKK